MVYGTIFSGYETMLCSTVFLLTFIEVMSQACGALMRFEDVALRVALNRTFYSFFKVCGAENFMV